MCIRDRQWTDPSVSDSIYGEQLSDANYGYNFDNLKLEGMTDTNSDESSRSTSVSYTHLSRI